MSLSFKETDFTTHRALDNTDPGFYIKGHKLRWVSPGVESRRAGRMWVPLKISALPKKIVDSLKEHNASWMSHGDTIRRRDLILSVAPLQEVNKKVSENKSQQKTNEAVFRGKAKVAGNSAIETTKDTSIRDERLGGDADSFEK